MCVLPPQVLSMHMGSGLKLLTRGARSHVPSLGSDKYLNLGICKHKETLG